MRPLLALAVLLAGCPDQPAPQDPSNQDLPINPSPSSSPTPPPPVTPAPNVGGDATPLPPAAVMAADPLIAAMAQSEAPGAQPDGWTIGGSFEEGQSLSQPVNIQAGRCYTVIGASLGGVGELDLQLVAEAQGMPPMVIAQDASSGPTAVLGGKASGCWKNPMPIALPAKLVVRVTRGRGMAVARAFSR